MNKECSSSQNLRASEASCDEQQAPPSAGDVPAVIPGWLYLLFFLSGISGLMFQVVWVRMLTRILGSTVYATSTVLAAFMAGLALGSYLIGRYIDRAHRPIVWYAVLELGIGLAALVSLALPDRLLPLYQLIYDSAGGSRAMLTAGQVLVALGVLLLPTVLMGATLPTLCAFGARCHGESFGNCVGNLYARNTSGAVVGTIASGFFLIGTIGETNTILLGVVLNISVAVAALVLGRVPGHARAQLPVSALTASAPPGGLRLSILASPGVRRTVLLSAAVSGFVALASEVVWSRMLLMHWGTSIYTFSMMLGLILTGMVIGSSSVGKRLDKEADPLHLLARTQLATAVVSAAALYLYYPSFPSFLAIVGRIAPLPLLLLLGYYWGVAFPVAVRCYAGSRDQAGGDVGRVLAMNTLGCIAGALAGGFILIPWLGSGIAAAALAATSALMALVLFAAHPARWWGTTRARQWLLFAACAALLLLAGDPYRRLTIDRAEALWPGRTVVYSHHEEAAGATTAFGEQGSELGKQLWVNGHGMTELETVTKLMAHLPIWLADDPHEALVICFGMGTTVRSASRHEALQVTAVELVPHVIECFRYFHADGPAVLSQANVRAVTDDGRNYLLMHAKQYDVITVDPAPPLYSAGTVNLYSRNFFQLCRDRLRPGGVMCLWIPPGSSSEVKMIMRTYLEVFEHVGFWSGTARYPGFLLLGSRQPRAGTLDRFRAGLQREAVRNDLLEWSSDLHSPEKLQALFLANGDELRDWLCDSPVITDDRPYTEFPLARAVLKPDEFRTWLTAEELRAYLNSRGRPHAGPSTTPP